MESVQWPQRSEGRASRGKSNKVIRIHDSMQSLKKWGQTTIIGVSVLTLVGIVVPLTVSADLGTIGTALVSTLIGYLKNILYVFAVLIIIIAAFVYLTAGGDAEKISKAHKMLVWALVAVLVAVLSTVLRDAVCDLGAAAGGGC